MEELKVKAKGDFKPPQIVKKKDGTFSVEYYPFERQRCLHNTNAMQILYGGAAGGGKSIAIRWECYFYCLRNAGMQAYLFRRYRTDLERNHIEWLNNEIPKELAVYNKTKATLEFINGSRLHFCYCERDDHLKSYQGAEIHLLVVDEATHLSAYQLNYLRTRLRLGSYSYDDRFVDKEYLPRAIFATNPQGGPGHGFLKENFVDAAKPETIFYDKTTYFPERKDSHGNILKEEYPGNTSIYIPAKMWDNPALDPNYEANFTGLPPELIKALKDGDWDSLVGSALFELSEYKHKIPDILKLYQEGKLPQFEYWTCFASVDWGTAAPFAITYYVVPDNSMDIKESKTGREIFIPEDSLIMFAEIYGCVQGQDNKGLGLPADAVCRRMLKFQEENKIRPDYYVADYNMWSASNGPAPEEHFRRHGVMLRQAKKERHTNYSEILARLHGTPYFKKEGAADYPMIYFTENCHAFWKTVPPLLLDEIDPNKGPANKQEDHIYDTLAYACRSRPFTFTQEDRRELELERWRDKYREAREDAGMAVMDPYATHI